METLHSHCGIYWITVQKTYTLKIEAVCSSETLITNYPSTWCHNSENCVNNESLFFFGGGGTDKPNHLYTEMYRNRMSTDGQCQKLSSDWPPRPTHMNVTSAQVSAGSVTWSPYHQRRTIPGCCEGCPHVRHVALYMHVVSLYEIERGAILR